MWRSVIHGKDEVLRLKTIYTEALPIANALTYADQARSRVEHLTSLNSKRIDSVVQLLDWLRMAFGIESPGTKLRSPFELEPDAFVEEVRKRRPDKAAITSSELALLRREHAETIRPAQHLLRTAARLERELSDIVNAAYGLTVADVELIWATAPPRMPAVSE